MYVQRQDQPAGRGRFLLALSLSTAIAVAAAAPLAFQAVTAESDGQVPPANSVEQPEDTSTTTTHTTGPTIGSRHRGQPIGEIVPGDDEDLILPAAPTVGARSIITPSTSTTTVTTTTIATTEPSTTTSSTGSSTTTSSTTTLIEPTTTLPDDIDSADSTG